MYRNAMMYFIVLLSMGVFLAGTEAIEICQAVEQGASCMTSCPDGFEEKYNGYPFCYTNKACCKPLPTTTTTATTTTTTPTTMVPSHKKCGIKAITVSSRIIRPDLPVSLNPMNCAWPWVISLHLTLNLPDGPSTAKICNGVLLNNKQFLTVKACRAVLDEPATLPFNPTLKAAVGRCNVSAVDTNDLVEVDVAYEEVGPDLLLMEFTTPIPGDYNLNFLPACLPDNKTEFRTNAESCVIASRSFGQGFVTSSRVPLLSYDVCDNIKYSFTSSPQREGTFCTSSRSTVNLCNGDEGGVVMCPDEDNNWVLKGVINMGKCDGEDVGTDEIIDIEPIGTEIINKLKP